MEAESLLQLIDVITKRIQAEQAAEHRKLASGYEHRLRSALIQYRELKESNKILRQSGIESTDDLRYIEGQLADAQRPRQFINLFWRQLLAAAGALILITASVATWLAWGHASSKANEPRNPVPSPAASASSPPPPNLKPDPKLKAEAVAREYLALGKQNDAAAMRSLVTDHFISDVAESEGQFTRAWDHDFLDIDAVVSPGQRPIVAPGGSAVWVQVAWRRKTDPDKDLRRQDFDSDWWKFLPSKSYELDDTDGRDIQCKPNDLLRCTEADRFTPP